MNINLWSNGCATVCDDDGRPIASLQRPWILCFADFLTEQGIDVDQLLIGMPGGNLAQLSKTGDGVLHWTLMLGQESKHDH